MGERCNRTAEVGSSNLLSSTNNFNDLWRLLLFASGQREALGKQKERLRIITLLVALAPAYAARAQEWSSDAKSLDTSATAPKSLEKGTAAHLSPTNSIGGHRSKPYFRTRDRVPNSHAASAGADFTVASMVGTDKRAAPRCHVGRAPGPKSTQESAWRHDWGPQPNSGIGFAWRRVNF